MRPAAPSVALLALLALSGCASTSSTTSTTASSTTVTTTTPASAPTSRGMIVTPSGLQYEDLKVGDGALAESGSQVLVHYTGTFTDGRKFDSSFDRGKPYLFRIDNNEVIRGWDEGIKGMRVGGKRRLVVPPQLAYGAAGYGNGAIPPNTTLVFEVELMDQR